MNAIPDAPALTPGQRKALKALAHHLDPVVMIGESGLTASVRTEADRALRAHELVKIRVFGDDRAHRLALMNELCAALGCAPVQVIGKLLVVYRPRGERDEAAAASARGRGPHRPKKALGAVAESGRKRPQPPLVARAPKPKPPRKAGGSTLSVMRAATANDAPASARNTWARTEKAPAIRGKAPASARKSPATGGKAPASARKPLPTRATSPSGARKSLSARTAGKRTDLVSASRPPVRKARASKATQAPPALQGKPGPRTGGPRNRAKGKTR